MSKMSKIGIQIGLDLNDIESDFDWEWKLDGKAKRRIKNIEDNANWAMSIAHTLYMD